MKHIFKKTFIILLFLSSFVPAIVFASSVSMSADNTVSVGDTFAVSINAETQGELINSIDMIIDYREDLMSFAGYENEGTVVRLWVEAPKEREGKIYFSGIIPGGVSGLYDANKQELGATHLTKLLFIARSDGNAEFTFVDSRLLKHDGKGTSISHEQKNEIVIIKSRTPAEPGTTTENIFDQTSPEPFLITFVEASTFSKIPAMILFNANDSGSGIKQYKIKIGGRAWRDTKSPEQVSKGIFPRTVIVRAYDHYDNYRDASIVIPGVISFQFLSILFTTLMLGILIYKLLKYRL